MAGINWRNVLLPNQWIVGAIVSIQFLLCISEANSALQCHHTISDCGTWEWFFAFIINLPFSIIIEQLFGLLPGSIVIQHFELSVAIRFLLYLIGGSLWWLMVFALFRWCRSLVVSSYPQE